MKKINKNFIITVLTVLIPLIMQFIYIRYVSYEVDKTIYGNFILLQTLVTGLSYIFIQIPSQAYDRFFNTTTDKIEFVNEFRTLLIGINLLSLFFIILYGYVMKKFSIEILFVIFIYFILLNNYSFNQKVFLLNLERKKYFFLKTMESSAKFITPIVAYNFYETLLSFVVGLMFGYMISFIILIKYMKSYPFKIVVNVKHLQEYFKFAYPILFTSIFMWGISFSDRYFIEFFLTTSAVAIYAILAQVAGIGQVFGQIYVMYVNPQVLRQFELDKTKSLVYLDKALKKYFLIFILLSLIAYFLPPQIYTILIEKSVINNPFYLKTFYILIIAIFVTVYQTAYSMYFVLFKKLNILAYIYFIAFFVNVIGNLFIKDYGIIAAALATLGAYITILLLQIIYVAKYIKNGNLND